MADVLYNCPRCSQNRFFMNRKGTQIGLYCSNCGAWVKWVSHKEAEGYSRIGMPIYVEGEEVYNAENRFTEKAPSVGHSCSGNCSSLKNELKTYVIGLEDNLLPQYNDGQGSPSEKEFKRGVCAALRQVIYDLNKMLGQ